MAGSRMKRLPAFSLFAMRCSGCRCGTGEDSTRDGGEYGDRIGGWRNDSWDPGGIDGARVLGCVRGLCDGEFRGRTGDELCVHVGVGGSREPVGAETLLCSRHACGNASGFETD